MNENSFDAEEYDLVVLGSGEGGKYLAWALARQGRRVAVVERKYIGGSCPNIACLPSKNVIHSAKVASYFFRSPEFGISKDNVQIDMSAVRDRKRKMVDGLVQMHLDNYKTSGAELILGSGRFVGPKTLEVDAERRKNTHGSRQENRHRNRHARNPPRHTRARRSKTPDPHRSPRAGPHSRASAGNGRRLRRAGTRAGDAKIRQPRHRHRPQSAFGPQGR